MYQYHIGVQLFCLTVIAPYMTQSRWKDDFLPPQQIRPVNRAWYVFPPSSTATLTSAQVLYIPSCLVIHEYGNFSGRSINVAISNSISYGYFDDFLDFGWKHFIRTSAVMSSYSILIHLSSQYCKTSVFKRRSISN